MKRRQAYPDVVERGLAGDIVEQEKSCGRREGRPSPLSTQSFM